MRGIHQCRCGVLDVFGYGVEANGELDQPGVPHNEVYTQVFITRVPSVYQEFVADQRDVRAGIFPPDHDPNFKVYLPAPAISDGITDHIHAILGTRVFWHGDRPYLMVFTSSSGKESGGGGYEDADRLDSIHLIDVLNPGNAPVISQFVAPTVWCSDIFQFYPWEFSILLGPDGNPSQFQEDEFWSMCIGVSKRYIVMVPKFHNDPNRTTSQWHVARYDLETNTMTFGLGIMGANGAGQTGELYIALPSQINDDGECWCLGVNHDDAAMWTGPCPALPGTNSDAAAIGKDATITATKVNQLSGKTGWNANINLPHAYTRRNGKDYVLAVHWDNSQINAYNFYYYNGATESWHSLGADHDYSNIYCHDDGTIVIAGLTRVLCINPDNTVRWTFAAGTTDPDQAFSIVSISGSDDWVQVKGMAIDATSLATYATADIFNSQYGWTTSEDELVTAWSFSLEGDGTPLAVVPHRCVNYVNGLQDTAGIWGQLELVNNRYVAVKNRWETLPAAFKTAFNESFENGGSPSAMNLLLSRQVLRGSALLSADRTAGQRNLDAVPGCSCGCLPDPTIGY